MQEMFERFEQMGTCRMHQSERLIIVVVLMVTFCCFSLLSGATGLVTDPSEVEALRAIKGSLIDPDGFFNNWNRGDPCASNWIGVVCHDMATDGFVHVKELQLWDWNLSGTLSPELGRFSSLLILDFMWNNITGSIPKEIGNITSLELLLLNGNQLTGTLPEELGYLANLNRIQIDENQISGPIPASFGNLTSAEHFHMNNNSLSGPIPRELSRLPNLVHLLLDNNNLSGNLPAELAEMPKLKILQLDNNHFDGSVIPDSYGTMYRLLKLSLRNCSLQGPIPNLGRIPQLTYLDLSFNRLNESIPPDKLSDNITTIDLSFNNLTGSIPANFSNLPRLQKLSLANNSLSGSVPAVIWQNRRLNGTETLIVDLQNNNLSNISGNLLPPINASLRLQGNPICSNVTLSQFCGSPDQDVNRYQVDSSSLINLATPENFSGCQPQSCPPPYEYAPPSFFFSQKYAPPSTVNCFCAAPLLVGYRLKSPGFTDFKPYRSDFQTQLTNDLKLNRYQLHINSTALEKGPRLRMSLKLFPVYVDNSSSNKFNMSEVFRIRGALERWTIPDDDFYGPYELLHFPLGEPYFNSPPPSSGLSKGAIVGIVLGAIAASVTLSTFVSLLIFRRYIRKYQAVSRRRQSTKTSIKIDNVKEFTYEEMALATKNFHTSSEVGQGGYGKVYKGFLADGTVVAIKRAQEGSLQGEKEFLTEIELLSRLHHRNLVSLIGYCDAEGEQMLVYEFMPNGTLTDHLSGKYKESMTFALRLRVAIGSAKGILYLHTEANPPIFHRDIKASNILLDSKYNAKVADFGLSRLAPVPDAEGTLPGHVSTVVKGTPGYLDPEYFLTRKLTDKSDVYSLGIVFLELLTGMQPISHGKNIVREVNFAYRSGMIFSIIDEQMGSYPSKCVEKFITLALRCCQDEPDARPSMAEVVRELESLWLMMPDSDTRIAESLIIDPQKVVTPPSSSASMRNTYNSSNVSGSDLVSGFMPSIVPR